VLAVSADGSTVLTGFGLYDMATDTTRTVKLDIGVHAATFSDDGRLLAVGAYDDLRVVDVASGMVVARLQGPTVEPDDYWRTWRTYSGVWVSEDGTRLVSTSSDGEPSHLWDVATGTVLRELPTDVLDRAPESIAVVSPELGDVMSTMPAGVEIRGSSGLAFIVAPDRATLLVHGFRKHSYGTWSEFTLPEGRPMVVHPQRWTAATFSPDGRFLLCVDDEGQVSVSPSRATVDVTTRARLVVHRELRDAERGAVGLAPRPAAAQGKIEL
jgi:WD40 repeat protein